MICDFEIVDFLLFCFLRGVSFFHSLFLSFLDGEGLELLKERVGDC